MSNEKSCASTSINWFPGHMKKTMEQIQKDLKLVDIVVELLDARIPMASQNPEIKKLIKDKKRIVVLNEILQICQKEPQSIKQIMEKLDYKSSKTFKKYYIKPLLEEGKLKMTLPEKPTSKNQKYITVD